MLYGKIQKKFQGYKSIIKEKCGIIFKEELNCQQIMKDDEDENNLIFKFENEKNGFIVMTYFAAPGEGHNYKIKKLINILIKIKEKFGDKINFVLFGDLNIQKNNISKKLERKIEGYGYKTLYKKNDKEFTREEVEGVTKTSYLDYFIIQGIDNFWFNIIHGGWISDHKGLELTIKVENQNRLKTLEQTIEAYEQTKKDYLKINMALTECLLDKGELRLNLNRLMGKII